MEIYYSSLPATLKTVMAKNKEKMDRNVEQVEQCELEEPLAVPREPMDPVKSLIQADIHCHHRPSRRTYGRRKSGVSDCPICEEEKRKRLECSDESDFIVYYYGNASETKTEQEQEPMKEESPVTVAASSSPPLVARASSDIYYSQTVLE